jgi:NAD+ kinase
MRIGIVTKHDLVEARATLADLEAFLRARGVTAVWAPEAAALLPAPPEWVREREALPAEVDLVVVLGGDGTLLATAGHIARSGRDVPILAVNFGSLGFLTEITRPELQGALAEVLDGRSTLDERMMLSARARRAGEGEVEVPVLNDVVFTRTALSRIIDLSVSIGEQLVMQVRADGLIVATPTGSSAYNLAAGGPIVHPEVDAIVLTPIAPHMLTNRPVVVPADSDVRVEPAMNGQEEVYVTFDGQSGHPLQGGDVIRIERADRTLRLVRARKRNYFDVLRQKLKWGAR